TESADHVRPTGSRENLLRDSQAHAQPAAGARYAVVRRDRYGWTLSARSRSARSISAARISAVGGDARFAGHRGRRADRQDRAARRMTVRTKLLEAILAVVAARTAASLFVAQRQSSESYDALVDEL